MTTDTRPPVELPAEVSVINVGLPLFADALREQGVPVQPVDWRIPAGGDLELVAALEQLYGPRSDAIETANAEVVRRLDEGVPQLVDVTPAATVLSRLPERTLLHCGPAVDWNDVCDPLRRSMRAAAVAESWAGDVEAADRLLAEGAIGLEPAYRYDTVVPMASAIGPSAPLVVVDNIAGNTRAFAPINQGPGDTAWFGRDTPAAIERLNFLQQVAGPMLRAVVQTTGPIDLWALAAQGVQIGDDVHMRTQGTTSLLVRSILPALAALPDDGRVEFARFLAGNHMFFLNLAMAAAKSVALWAEQVTGSSIVTTMCRNGTTYGIRLAGSDKMFQSPAPPIDGRPVLRGLRPGERSHGHRRQRHLGTRRPGRCSRRRLTRRRRLRRRHHGRRRRNHRADGIDLRRAQFSIQAADVGQRRHAARRRRSSSRRDRDDTEDYHRRPARQFRRRTDRRRSRDRAPRMLPGRGVGTGRASTVILGLLLAGDNMSGIINQDQRSQG